MAPLSQEKFTIVKYIDVDGYCQNFIQIGLVVLFWPRVEAVVSADFRKMEKEQYRSVIWFLFLEGKSRSEIKKRLDAVYGDFSPSMATVKNWFKEFERGRTSVFNEPRPGALKTATTEDSVTKIYDFVMADRRLKVREIVETVCISKDRVGHIPCEMLGMKKLSARWVPRLLTPNNKCNRKTISEQYLTLFKCNMKEFLRRFVTVDETWIHWYTPETKQQSKEWISPDLAPCDFFLFPNLKKSLAGQKFESNEEVIATTEAYFADIQ